MERSTGAAMQCNLIVASSHTSPRTISSSRMTNSTNNAESVHAFPLTFPLAAKLLPYKWAHAWPEPPHHWERPDLSLPVQLDLSLSDINFAFFVLVIRTVDWWLGEMASMGADFAEAYVMKKASMERMRRLTGEGEKEINVSGEKQTTLTTKKSSYFGALKKKIHPNGLASESEKKMANGLHDI